MTRGPRASGPPPSTFPGSPPMQGTVVLGLTLLLFVVPVAIATESWLPVLAVVAVTAGVGGGARVLDRYW